MGDSRAEGPDRHGRDGRVRADVAIPPKDVGLGLPTGGASLVTGAKELALQALQQVTSCLRSEEPDRGNCYQGAD
jgi:hypothetical protein